MTVDPFISSGTEDKTENTTTNAAGLTTKITDKSENKDDTIARLSARWDGKTQWADWFVKAGVQQGKIEKDVRSSETSYTYSTKKGITTATSKTVPKTEFEIVQESNHYVGGGIEKTVGKHTVATGIDWHINDFDIKKTKTDNGKDSSAVKETYQVNEDKASIYLEDLWRIANKHSLTAGARWDWTQRRATDGNGVSQQAHNQALNPSLHYVWNINDGFNLRASAVRTIKLPKFDKLNPLVTSSSGTESKPDTAGNANLQAEKVLGFYVGVEKFFMDGNGSVGLNLYNREIKDYVEDLTALEGSRYIKRPQNIGRAHFYGVELDWRIPVLQKGAHRLTVTSNYAELRGSVTSKNTGIKRDVKDIPPRVINLGVDWRHSPSNVSAGFSVNYQPTFTADSINDDGIREVKTRKATTTLDAYLTKRFNQTTSLKLIVKNILAVKKDEVTTKYTDAGMWSSSERKVESSKPTASVIFEHRF